MPSGTRRHMKTSLVYLRVLWDEILCKEDSFQGNLVNCRFSFDGVSSLKRRALRDFFELAAKVIRR